ncbi:MAG: hypothetical protein HQL80_06875 [Magnetococcales bacterium]|nr:hypothetical protein [Magnetococcales bacterium]
MKKVVSGIAALLVGVAVSGAVMAAETLAETCKKSAAEMKLTGATADEFIRQCVNPVEACKEMAKQMNLAGTTADEFVKQCTAAETTGQ